jgi:hypothetical protein
MARPQAFFEAQEVGGTATAAAALPRNESREFLQIHNPTGASWKYRFGAAPDATNGVALPAGATMTYDARVPTGALFIASGSAYYLIHG